MNLKTTIKTTIERLSRISETSYPALKWKEKFLSQIKIHTGVHLTVLTIATLNLTKLRVLKTKNCNYIHPQFDCLSFLPIGCLKHVPLNNLCRN